MKHTARPFARVMPCSVRFSSVHTARPSHERSEVMPCARHSAWAAANSAMVTALSAVNALCCECALLEVKGAARDGGRGISCRFDPLRYAMEDRLHQQYRSHMFPFTPFIKTALEAGAHGAFLSGAGPTILAIAGGVGVADVGSDTMSQFLAEAVRATGLDRGPCAVARVPSGAVTGWGGGAAGCGGVSH